MSDEQAFDRLLRSWFTGGAAPAAPAHLVAKVAHATRGRRQQPGWLARLAGGDPAVVVWAAVPTGRALLAVAVLAGAVLAVVAGTLLSVGGSQSPVPDPRVLRASTPWSFEQSPDVCPEVVTQAFPPGPLPAVGAPVVEQPRNGMIAINSGTLLDPITAASTTTRLPGPSTIYGNRWSPDGRWLALGWGGGPAAGNPPSCRDIYLLASDGMSLANVTGYPSDDQAINVAWSPDAKWLAIARWVAIKADGGVAIDVVEIGPAGSVVDARRLWTSDAKSIQSLGWSNQGDLAWMYGPTDDHDWGMLVLHAGEIQPTSIDLGGVSLVNPRWATSGQELIAAGNRFPGFYVVRPSTRTVEAVGLAVPPLSGTYTWDSELFTSSAGRVFYPAHTERTGVLDIYSANLDGSGVDNLTSFPASDRGRKSFDAVLSPDETQVAFGRDTGDSTWLVDADGTSPARRLSARYGDISWQPIP